MIARHLRKGCRVAISDGAGAPVGLHAAITQAARDVGGVELLLGWCLEPPVDIEDKTAFPVVRTFMGGYALRSSVACGRVEYLPVRLGALPALLEDALRPDVLIVSARGNSASPELSTEAAWISRAAETATTVLVELNAALPEASGEQTLENDNVIIVSETSRHPYCLPTSTSGTEALDALGGNAAALVPAGAAIQFGPGPVAAAVVAAIQVPVRIDSGVVTDAVLELDDRGLLLGVPTAAYITGTSRLYKWAEGRPITRRIEYTHDIARLSSRPFVALNTALEIDETAQVNVEAIGPDPVGGVGGHGDYAIAASRSTQGLSLIVVPTTRGSNTTLVERLSAPASTAAPDIDVVVTELGTADLRGLGADRRSGAIRAIWPERSV